MQNQDSNKVILEEAERIKRDRTELEAATRRHQLENRTRGQRFMDFWENKLIPAFWIVVAMFFFAEILGLLR